jgi:hypothetical protein
MDKRCARASRLRVWTVRLSALAVVAAMTLAVGPTERILDEPSATERPSFSATALPITCPGGKHAAARALNSGSDSSNPSRPDHA